LRNVIRRSAKAVSIVAAATLGLTSSALADWQGTWRASGEEWLIVDEDGRVFGDIGANGYFEGRASADGQSLRAAFRFSDGRWGIAARR
jgi:hypothetical protein